MKKHIAKLTNTDQRCVVVFMQIPGDRSHALIVSTDTLPPRFEQAVMEVVESAEGQADPVLANVLNRRLLPDTGENLLTALHHGQLLRRVHIDQVIMMPRPNMPISLRKVIDLMGGEAPEPSAEHPEIDDAKFNPHTQNTAAMASEERVGIARNLLMEAADLEHVARQKREKAYAVAPELAPASVPAPAAKKAKTVLKETGETVEKTVTKAAPKRIKVKATDKPVAPKNA